MIYICFYESPIGRITMASDGLALKGLWLEGQKYYERTISGQEQKVIEAGFAEKTAETRPKGCEDAEKNSAAIFRQSILWLDDYFSPNKGTGSKLPPLSPDGTDFQKLIWKILLTIPAGSTMTYGEIAKLAAERMDKKSMSAQAVGGAVGRNPISIMIPCHRVIGSNGKLTGYAGGTDKKAWLLEHERCSKNQV